MKVRLSPTSPKAKLQQQSDALADLYTQHMHRLEPPQRRPRISYFALLLALVLGFCGGVLGELIASLYLVQPADLGVSVSSVVSTRLPVKRNQRTAPVSGETLRAAHKEVLALYSVQKLSGTIEDAEQLTTQVGSAILLTEDGWAVTVSGALETGKNIAVAVTNDRSVFALRSVIRDPASDLVFFQIDGTNYQAAPLGELTSFDPVTPFAILAGNAQSTTVRSRGMFLEGATRQRGAYLLSSDRLTRLVHLASDVPAIYNGGPLVDQQGAVVGVVVTDGGQDAFAVPVAHLRTTLREVLRTKSVRRPYLGIRYIDLGLTPGVPEAVRAGANVGALITGTKTDPAVTAGSPAETAGLRSGDVITAVGPEKLSETQGLQELVLSYQPGDSVEFTLVRAAKEQKVSVLLGEQSSE